jgi:hypothetical protein
MSSESPPAKSDANQTDLLQLQSGAVKANKIKVFEAV